MNTQRGSRGFEEISHTADWALRVWAPDFPQLAAAALEGMFMLMKPQVSASPISKRNIEVCGADEVELLVGFLSESLYLLESASLVPVHCEISVKKDRLRASITASRAAAISKIIKAVTYHNLTIQSSPEGLECTLVFDV